MAKDIKSPFITNKNQIALTPNIPTVTTLCKVALLFAVKVHNPRNSEINPVINPILKFFNNK